MAHLLFGDNMVNAQIESVSIEDDTLDLVLRARALQRRIDAAIERGNRTLEDQDERLSGLDDAAGTDPRMMV